MKFLENDHIAIFGRSKMCLLKSCHYVRIMNINNGWAFPGEIFHIYSLPLFLNLLAVWNLIIRNFTVIKLQLFAGNCYISIVTPFSVQFIKKCLTSLIQLKLLYKVYQHQLSYHYLQRYVRAYTEIRQQQLNRQRR